MLSVALKASPSSRQLQLVLGVRAAWTVLPHKKWTASEAANLGRQIMSSSHAGLVATALV